MKTVMIPLAVASDESSSIAYSEQQLINVYPEKSRFGAKSPFVLLGCPALKPWTTAGSGPHRGAITMFDILYVVSGAYLYKVTSDGTATQLGTITGTEYVSMATAGTQVAIATEAGVGYIYDSSTLVLARITDPDFFGGTSVCSIDGYFMWSSGETYPTRFQFSALLDGMSYDALDFASAESSANKLVRCFTVGSQIFLFKTDRTEVWYDSGNADFPFERMNSTVIGKGLAAKFSPALLDNSVFWVGRDDVAGGSPLVYRAAGYVPQIISTPAVVRALEAVDDLSLVHGVSYVKDNHSFYGLILPTGNSWWFDVESGAWHERRTYGYDRWLGNIVVSAYGQTYVGSFEDGALYQFDDTVFFDNDTIPLVAEFTLPTYGSDPNLKRCSRLRLDMEAGVGINNGQGSDPIITLNVSDNRGQTLSSDLNANIGKIGRYDYGVEWRRLGQFRSRVHRFRLSDPVKRAFIALYADIE